MGGSLTKKRSHLTTQEQMLIYQQKQLISRVLDDANISDNVLKQDVVNMYMDQIHKYRGSYFLNPIYFVSEFLLKFVTNFKDRIDKETLRTIYYTVKKGISHKDDYKKPKKDPT